MKLNPNHPVAQSMDEQWAKVVALLLYRDGARETAIPADVVERALADPAGLNIAIKFDDVRGIILYLVDDKEAQRLAKQEGGLPA